MTMYFENILANLSVHTDFDVYGHLDYAIRYAKEKDKNYSYEKYKNIIDRILETILSLGKGIEINTAGLRKGLRSTNPCFEIRKALPGTWRQNHYRWFGCPCSGRYWFRLFVCKAASGRSRIYPLLYF